MGKSPAERQREYKQRLKKQGRYKEWQENVKIAKRKERSKARMTKAGTERLKLKNRIYTQAKRKRDKLGRLQEVDNRADFAMADTAFKSRQHYGRPKCRQHVETLTMEMVSIKREPEWILGTEEEGSSSFEPGHALQEGEGKLTRITEVVIKEERIKEEPWDPTLDNPPVITKVEGNDLEADTYRKETEDNTDRSCEDQSSFSSDLHGDLKVFKARRRWQCPICQRVLASSSSLKNHNFVHTGEKRFACKYCDKKFKQNMSLVRHEATHTGERPYSCPHCSKPVATPCYVCRHIQTENKEKYNCSICNRNLINKEKFASHMLAHTSNNMHCCKVCNRIFAHRPSLRRHLKVHASDKSHA